jgi:hypothetical protein
MPISKERYQSMLAWRVANPDLWAKINRQSSQRYYQKNRDKILAKRKEKKLTK